MKHRICARQTRNVTLIIDIPHALGHFKAADAAKEALSDMDSRMDSMHHVLDFDVMSADVEIVSVTKIEDPIQAIKDLYQKTDQDNGGELSAADFLMEVGALLERNS